MKRIALAGMVAVVVTACTPAEVEWWTADTDAQVADCHHAVDRLWPPGSAAWAHRIVDRESGGDPAAQNTRSSAAGCFQLLRIHAHRFAQFGYRWADRYNARANTLAALDLYTEQGARPWS